MKKLFISLILFLFSSLLFSGTIKGKILDSYDKKPLKDVVVILTDLDLTSITDQEGIFQFRDIDPGVYNLLVIAPGFGEKLFEINTEKEEDMEILLDRPVIELEVIKVIGKKEKYGNCVKKER